jgi:HPt (histidine-containing phosphotransfer) domain-containing protein
MTKSPHPDCASAIDAEQIDGLILAAGVDGVRDILDAFARSTQNLLLNLREELARGDLRAAARTAHALKGSALNVGAVLLSDAARGIETSCKADDAQGAEKSLDEANASWASTAAAFATRLDQAA